MEKAKAVADSKDKILEPQLLKEGEQELLQVIRSEVNLLVLPFFALNNREVTERRETEFQAVVTRDGQRVEIRWVVSANARYGYPGPFDKKLFRAIEHLLSQMKLPIKNPIAFSTYELCRLVGKGIGGRQYEGVKEILRRLVATTIRSSGTFFHKGRKKWLDDTFHLYDRVVFKGEELPNGRLAETNHLFLSAWYLDNLNSRYVRPIDYEYYNRIKSTIAQRLYEILGVKFYRLLKLGIDSLRYRYSTLCQLLPIARQKYLSKAKEKLDPAHQELTDTGFLSEVTWCEAGEGDWLIYYYPGSKAREEIEKFQVPEEAFSLEIDQQEAIARGVMANAVEVEGIVASIIEVTGDEHSRGFYTQLAKLAIEKPRLYDLIYRCLSEVKDEWHRGLIRTTKGAVFTDKIKRYCRQYGIELGLKSDKQKG